jgi:competence protein ComGF
MTEPWGRDDTAWLRNMLGQPSGQKLIVTLRGMIPKIKSMTKESAWVAAVEKQGQETMLEKFLDLAEFQESNSIGEFDYVDLTKEKD